MKAKKYKEINDTNGQFILSDNEGVYHTPQPLSFDHVWQLFQETNKKFQESDKKFQEYREENREAFRASREQMLEAARETDKKFQKTDKKFQETDKKFQETDKKIQEAWEQIKKTQKQVNKTTRTVKAVSRMVGGMSNTRGEVTEDFFKAALKNTKSIAGIKYSYRGKLHKVNGTVRGEYDIVLFGEEVIIVVEVKHKLQPDDVNDFHERRLPKFKTLFPEFGDKKLVGALAGLTIDKEAAKKALSLGYILLTQDGQMIKVISKMEN